MPSSRSSAAGRATGGESGSAEDPAVVPLRAILSGRQGAGGAGGVPRVLLKSSLAVPPGRGHARVSGSISGHSWWARLRAAPSPLEYAQGATPAPFLRAGAGRGPRAPVRS